MKTPLKFLTTLLALTFNAHTSFAYTHEDHGTRVLSKPIRIFDCDQLTNLGASIDNINLDAYPISQLNSKNPAFKKVQDVLEQQFQLLLSSMNNILSPVTFQDVYDSAMSCTSADPQAQEILRQAVDAELTRRENRTGAYHDDTMAGETTAIGIQGLVMFPVAAMRGNVTAIATGVLAESMVILLNIADRSYGFPVNNWIQANLFQPFADLLKGQSTLEDIAHAAAIKYLMAYKQARIVKESGTVQPSQAQLF